MRKVAKIAGPFCAFTALLWLSLSGCSAGEEALSSPKPADGSFAVVELFTSEGCSSCPPADTLLGEIADDAQRRGSAIFPIAFHIDYWDNLGWRDRFSLAESTDRQQRYAKVLDAQIYTPQMIVNGQTQFVGSDRDAYRRAVAAALSASSTARLSLKLINSDSGNLSIGYYTTSSPAGSVLNFVIVQRAATTDVPRGENGGRTLHHVNIVRSIKTVALGTASGQVGLALPHDLDPKDALLIGFVQDAVTLKIVAASRLDLPAANKPTP